MASYYPAFLNLKDKKVILFGGGQVALRKARRFVQTGARLIAISREFSSAFLRFAKQNRILIQHKSHIPKTFKGVTLVTAATSDPEFNSKIYRQCVRQGVLINVVDDPEHSTFIVPSVVRRGRLQIAISTGGASPLLAKRLRQRLTREFGREYGNLVKRLASDRAKTKRTLVLGRARQNHFKALVSKELQVLERRSKR